MLRASPVEFVIHIRQSSYSAIPTVGWLAPSRVSQVPELKMTRRDSVPGGRSTTSRREVNRDCATVLLQSDKNSVNNRDCDLVEEIKPNPPLPPDSGWQTVGAPPMIELHPRSVTLAAEVQLENERQSALMRTANEQLVLATLDARAIQTELEVANRRQMDFMAVLAHELRNPLAPMRNVSALLARIQLDDPILPRLQDIIERQVVHMARMIDDLLDVTRAQNGTLAVNKRTTELTALVADAIATCQPEMDLRQQELTSNLPSSPVYVVGDAIRLTQIFTNLLSSASKHTRNGGSLTLAMTADAPNVVVTLIDNDSAPTTDARPTIFDQFDPDVHSRGVRRSIGLTVIDELVKAHGGSVTARVRGPGCGNQLVVTLPILRRATAS